MKVGVWAWGCALLPFGALAHSNGEPAFFQATRLPLAEYLSVRGDPEGKPEVASFAAFMPLPDAASLRTQIAGLEDAGDRYTPRIAELSEQLGKVLQAEGQHRAALAAFEHSFQISRRQEGLHSPMQAALLEAQITSQLALGDVDAVDALHDALFTLQQDLYATSPVALAAAHRSAADWNLRYYVQARQTAVPGGRTDAQQLALAERLGTALRQYHQALWLLGSEQTDGLNDTKAAIERKIAALTLLVDREHQRNAPATLTKYGQSSVHQDTHNPVLVAHGSAALQRAAAYAAGADPVQHAERQLELADWYLLTDRYDEAQAAYAAAEAALKVVDIDDEQRGNILASGLPVHDPELELRALEQDDAAAIDADGYIDVAFDLDRYGRASNARVLAGSGYDAADDTALEQALLRQVRAGRFRPEFVDGAAVPRSDVMLRYYFAR